MVDAAIELTVALNHGEGLISLFGCGSPGIRAGLMKESGKGVPVGIPSQDCCLLFQ
jgi:hypothetical protein